MAPWLWVSTSYHVPGGRVFLLEALGGLAGASHPGHSCAGQAKVPCPATTNAAVSQAPSQQLSLSSIRLCNFCCLARGNRSGSGYRVGGVMFFVVT
jgi:hypothetical protein